MQYLNKTFNGPNPSSTDGLVCEACVYGERWHPEHSQACQKRLFVCKACGKTQRGVDCDEMTCAGCGCCDWTPIRKAA